MLLQLSRFFLPYIPLHPAIPTLQHSPPPTLSSCPWVVHINSLASPFPILFLTSPCLLCIYQFMLLNPFTFFPILALPPPADNPPCDLHFCDTAPVLVVCLVFVFVFQVQLLIVGVCCHFVLHIFDHLLFLR